MLSQKAKDLEVFESSSSVEIQPLSNIDSNITVEKVEGVIVTIRAEISGLVMPDIDKDEISSDLAGSSWEEGKNYLAKLTYVAKPTEVEFTPSYFPKFLWHFPPTKNRVLISIVEVDSSDLDSESGDSATSTDGTESE